MPLDHRCRLDQHHRLQTKRPQSVKPDPEQTVDREQPEPTRPLAAKIVQLMTEGEVLQLHNRPTTESAYQPRNDRSLELIHAGETRAANAKTLDFSPLSEFSVATADLWIPFCGNGSTINGLVAAFSSSGLDEFAAGNSQVKPKAVLIGSGFNCPIALTFDHSGNLWIANAGSRDDNFQSIIEYTAASLFQKNQAPSVTLTSSSFDGLRSLTFDAAGDLWVSVTSDSTDGVYEFTPQQLSSGGAQSDALVVQSPPFIYPDDIVFDAANNIWISYSSRTLPGVVGLGAPGAVQMFKATDLTGSGTIEQPAAVTLGGLSRCSVLTFCGGLSLAFDQSGNLWVAQSYTISEFTPAQLASGNTPLAQIILATNYANVTRLGSWNFLGPVSVIFGPATK